MEGEGGGVPFRLAVGGISGGGGGHWLIGHWRGLVPLTPALLSLLPGNKHKWVPLMIEVKSEGPRERSASRNNTRQNEPARMPPNARNDLRGEPP